MPYHHIKLLTDDYLAGTISEADKARFEEILADDEDSRRYVEEEKRLRAALIRDDIPDPGERYWDGLEESILSQTIRRATEDSYERTIVSADSGRDYLRPLLALAASLVLFAASIAVTGQDRAPALRAEVVTTSTIVVTPDAEETFIQSVYSSVSAELNILSAMVSSPPGGVLTGRLVPGALSSGIK